MTRMYLIKYALTEERIDEAKVRISGSGMYVAREGGYALFKIGRDAFADRAEAVAAAETKRLKKIASLKKQLAKLEALRFE